MTRLMILPAIALALSACGGSAESTVPTQAGAALTTLEGSPSTAAPDTTALASDRTEATIPSAETNGELVDPAQVCGFIKKVLADGAAAGVDAPDYGAVDGSRATDHYIVAFGLEALDMIARPYRPIMDDGAVQAACPDDYAAFILKSGVGSLQFF